jgi:hypothetical protein
MLVPFAICPTLELPEQEKIKISVGSHKHFSSIFQSPFFTSPHPSPQEGREKGLFDPLFDFFHLWNLSSYLYNSIHNQGWSDQYTVIGDGFKIFNLDNLGFNP